MKLPSAVFDKEHAAAYDARFAKLAPSREALYLLMRILFGHLPERARILCVGAGTGAEIGALASAFPGFEFTAVEPAEAMLDVCRQRARDEGFERRCTFFNGFIENLPGDEPYDAATSLLVSQFLTERAARVKFFSEIARRLRPGSWLVDAELSGNLQSDESSDMKEFWKKMLVYSGLPEEQAGGFLKGWATGVAVVPEREIEKIIAEGGFERPTRIYQSLFIHGWAARRI